MPNPKTLSSFFRSALKPKKPTKISTTSGAAAKSTPAAADATLKNYVSSLDVSSPSISHYSVVKNTPKPPIETPSVATHSILDMLNLEASASDSEEATSRMVQDISSILGGDGTSVNPPGSQGTSCEKSLDNNLDIPWFSISYHESASLRRKEISRARKRIWVFKSTQGIRRNKLVSMCAQKLGTEATVNMFGKLGCETGVKEYNALIKICIDKISASDDENVALEHISLVFQLIKSMKEQGFRVEEETYGPFLMYLINMGMVEEFTFFSEIIKEGNPSSLARLGYYEILLYIAVDNKEKIQELFSHFCNNNLNETISLREHYLLALCERDQKKEILQLLELIDITKVSSLDHLVIIFKSLGRLLLEALAEKFLLEFKECGFCWDSNSQSQDHGKNSITTEQKLLDISTLIFNYATSMPNISVEDVILKFQNWHSVLEMEPPTKSYEKLIIYSCDLLKVHAALDLVEQMCREGLTFSTDVLNSILNACEESFEFHLGQRVYSLINCHNLKPDNETFRSMISLTVKMKDFGGAYDILDDLKKFNMSPTASMYSAIMAGYYREKNINGALMVLKKMELADVKPDSVTYSYLIANCNSEDQINKYYEELKVAGLPYSKQIFMALINSYATCGLFEKAKQVLLDVKIPCKNLNEIKSVLISALASHGQLSDAFAVYEEIKETGDIVEPKTVISLIEHFQSQSEPNRLLELLEELKDSDYWIDGCCRVLLFCIRNKHLSSGVNLLKQLMDRCSNNELSMQVIFDEVFAIIAELEPTNLQIGLDLLQVIKNELCFSLSRKSLDFLLSACAKAKDLHNSLLIWKEYQAAGYPYNGISYLRMYQALLASGDHKSAEVMLAKIPKDDLHVRLMIRACQTTYMKSGAKEKNKKKKR